MVKAWCVLLVLVMYGANTVSSLTSAGNAWVSTAYYGYYTQVQYQQNAQAPYYIAPNGNDVPEMDTEMTACSAVIPINQWTLVSPANLTMAQSITLYMGVYDSSGVNGSVTAYYICNSVCCGNECCPMEQYGKQGQMVGLLITAFFVVGCCCCCGVAFFILYKMKQRKRRQNMVGMPQPTGMWPPPPPPPPGMFGGGYPVDPQAYPPGYPQGGYPPQQPPQTAYGKPPPQTGYGKPPHSRRHHKHPPPPPAQESDAPPPPPPEQDM